MNAAKKQIDDIFFAALAIGNDSQRRSFLDQACASDSALRAAVDKMLSDHTASEDFFTRDSSALTLTAEDFQAAADEHIFEESSLFDERLGLLIGNYKLLQRIGE